MRATLYMRSANTPPKGMLAGCTRDLLQQRCNARRMQMRAQAWNAQGTSNLFAPKPAALKSAPKPVPKPVAKLVPAPTPTPAPRSETPNASRIEHPYGLPAAGSVCGVSFRWDPEAVNVQVPC